MVQNSAHDDITILAEDDEWASLRRQITSPTQRTVFDVLQTMLMEQSQGDLQAVRQTLQLKHTQEEAYITVEAYAVEHPGWAAQTPTPCQPDLDNMGMGWSQDDLDAIERGEYEIECIDAITPEPMTLDVLLADMDAYGVGRPSTFASTFDNLIHENEFIDIDEATGHVKLTTKGLEAALILEEVEPDLSSAVYTTGLVTALDQVEVGETAPKEPILSVYEDAYGKEAADHMKDIIWTDIDSLYEDPLVETPHIGGFITLPEPLSE